MILLFRWFYIRIYSIFKIRFGIAPPVTPFAYQVHLPELRREARQAICQDFCHGLRHILWWKVITRPTSFHRQGKNGLNAEICSRPPPWVGCFHLHWTFELQWGWHYRRFGKVEIEVLRWSRRREAKGKPTQAKNQSLLILHIHTAWFCAQKIVVPHHRCHQLLGSFLPPLHPPEEIGLKIGSQNSWKFIIPWHTHRDTVKLFFSGKSNDNSNDSSDCQALVSHSAGSWCSKLPPFWPEVTPTERLNVMLVKAQVGEHNQKTCKLQTV